MISFSASHQSLSMSLSSSCVGPAQTEHSSTPPSPSCFWSALRTSGIRCGGDIAAATRHSGLILIRPMQCTLCDCLRTQNARKKSSPCGKQQEVVAMAQASQLTPHHCSTPHHRSTPHRTAPHRTAPHRTAPHRTAPHRTAPHRTAPHRTAPHRTAPHRTAPHPQHSTMRVLCLFFVCQKLTPMR